MKVVDTASATIIKLLALPLRTRMAGVQNRTVLMLAAITVLLLHVGQPIAHPVFLGRIKVYRGKLIVSNAKQDSINQTLGNQFAYNAPAASFQMKGGPIVKRVLLDHSFTHTVVQIARKGLYVLRQG